MARSIWVTVTSSGDFPVYEAVVVSTALTGAKTQVSVCVKCPGCGAAPEKI